MFGDSLSFKVVSNDWPIHTGKVFRVEYETTEACSAAQWLTPEQTVGKKFAYLFTQCQAIHARSLVPCQVQTCNFNNISIVGRILQV
jgi:aminopeptidase N